jgi:serine/threonine protein kinase
VAKKKEWIALEKRSHSSQNEQTGKIVSMIGSTIPEGVSMAGVEDALEVGDQIDSYRVDAMLSQDRAATVYRATDVRSGQTVALKVPDPDLEADPFRLERFRRAAAIGEKLGHHGVLRVISEVERSRVYMVMEWCDGVSLRGIMNGGKLEPERAIRIAEGVLEALQYIHDNGVVHRALMPESVMIEAGDKIKLIDFGLAADATSRRLTYTNLADELGRGDYVSPEQVAGKRGDNRADLYSLGVILYEMVTGKLPFPGKTPMEAMRSRLVNHPIPPTVITPSLSLHLQEVIYRALERDPKNRYGRARDFAHDLQHLDQVGIEGRSEIREWQKQKPRLPRNFSLYLLLLLAPIGILIVMWLLSRSK